MIYRRYRYRIYPTKVQVQQLAQHFGAVRYIYNWGLETKKKAWDESKERISYFDLTTQLTVQKREIAWLNDPYRDSLCVALKNVETAFQQFFRGKGYPRFKSKRHIQSISYAQQGRKPSMLDCINSTIRIPKVGIVKCLISRPLIGRLKQLTVSKTPTGKYFASCLIEIDSAFKAKADALESDAIGIDLGIKSFATLSTGELIDNPRFFNKSLKSVSRAARKHNRKKQDSKNREKSRKRLVRLYERVVNKRHDFLHKLTTKLTRDSQVGTVCIEDLNVAGMGRNHKLARHIQDAGWGKFREMLTYKADWYGVNLKVIDRFAPSSRMCTCGIKNTELTLKQRSWTCAACGTTHDRDLLAAQNIVRFAFHPETVVKSTIGRGTPESTLVETLALAGQ